jgi:FkbM family methyltransferase
MTPQERWREVNGDETLKMNYPLNENSVVYDIGGYLGDWSQRIADKYNSIIWVFEPIQEFYHVLVKRFRDNQRITVVNAGVSDSTKRVACSKDKDGSSTYLTNGSSEEVLLVDAAVIKQADLLNLNCEGAEFDIIPRLIETGNIKNIKHLQAQLHPFVPNAEVKREEIRKLLASTHKESFSYEFLWEGWERRND